MKLTRFVNVQSLQLIKETGLSYHTPLYSLDLALSDFHLFGPMKDGLRG